MSAKTASRTADRPVPWVEKYRPQSLDELSSQDHVVNVLKRTMGSANLPHMLFYGPPGTGKTSTILALAKELYGPDLAKTRVLELNASDDRGISIIRDKVKNFARSAISKPARPAGAFFGKAGAAAARPEDTYPCPPFKIVILDEADSLTADAQSALRRTMETYTKLTRFCIVCNYVTRIIPPLASRCAKFRFRALDAGDAVARIEYICGAEGVPLGAGAAAAVVAAAAGDLRRGITLLQGVAGLVAAETAADADADGDVAMGAHEVTVADIEDVAGLVPAAVVDGLVAACRGTGPLEAVVGAAVLDGWSAGQVVLQLHDALIFSDSLAAAEKNQIARALGEADKRLVDGADEELVLLDLAVCVREALTPASK
ncbi:P-loop containing nucleoside triphosphate hydrolase [Dipodascopsis tothii]|uniref:P-loop containing nucleoside triphosphate hydrolase n=1 Tax=Dipodascopsis tothii TaxID=44089 RepID=UPI0034CF53D6